MQPRIHRSGTKRLLPRVWDVVGRVNVRCSTRGRGRCDASILVGRNSPECPFLTVTISDDNQGGCTYIHTTEYNSTKKPVPYPTLRQKGARREMGHFRVLVTAFGGVDYFLGEPLVVGFADCWFICLYPLHSRNKHTDIHTPEISSLTLPLAWLLVGNEHDNTGMAPLASARPLD